jgi:hypothetical protein
VDRPIYYRFAFSPSSGEVILSHNEEDHPARVRYHTDLSNELGEGETYHGYVYRIGRGWRVTDWEHKPLNDPFINAAVLRALRKEEGPHHPHPELDWQEVQEEPAEFDKFHYGLPAA